MGNTTLTRMTAATVLGAVVTTLVILLMQSLIETEGQVTNEPPAGGTLTFLREIEETPPQVRDPRAVKPPQPITPPPLPPDVTAGTGPNPVAVAVTPPRVDPRGGPTLTVFADGDALPVVKVRPVYPARARERGIEGYVLVQFTIDELGRVVDVEVLEATPHGMFERAALKAVERFRYKPRVVDGQPVPVSGVRHLVTFELSS